MTPKEKAKELMLLYHSLIHMCTIDLAKKCALIAVDEIIDSLDKSLIHADIMWWQEVKKEILKI